MKASNKCVNLIQLCEGKRLTAYIGEGGNWLIGFGHAGNVWEGKKISNEQAYKYLKEDLEKFELYVNKRIVQKVGYELTQNQFDALVSFAYNTGRICSGFYKALINENLVLAVTKLMQYVNADNEYNLGIHRRRVLEALLFTDYNINEADRADIRHRKNRIELNDIGNKIVQFYKNQIEK